MSLFRRRQFLLGAVALGGCGFEPVYQTGGNAQGLRGAVLVDPPTDRDSFDLVEQLEQRLGRPTAPRFAMSVKLITKEEGLAISDSNDITRFNVIGSADYAVRAIGSDEILLQDRVDSFTAYSASQQPVATLSGERDARARLMVTLADKITAQLLISTELR